MIRIWHKERVKGLTVIIAARARTARLRLRLEFLREQQGRPLEHHALAAVPAVRDKPAAGCGRIDGNFAPGEMRGVALHISPRAVGIPDDGRIRDCYAFDRWAGGH